MPTADRYANEDDQAWTTGHMFDCLTSAARAQAAVLGVSDKLTLEVVEAAFCARLQPALAARFAAEFAPRRDVQGLRMSTFGYARNLRGLAKQVVGRERAGRSLDEDESGDGRAELGDSTLDPYEVLLGRERLADAVARKAAERHARQDALERLEELVATQPSAGARRAQREALGASRETVAALEGVSPNAICQSIRRWITRLSDVDREALAPLKLIDENPSKGRRHS